MNAGDQLDLARSLISNMDDLGVSLHTAATDLCHDCTLERIDSFLDRLQAATNTVVHIRKALAGERVSTVKAGGTG